MNSEEQFKSRIIKWRLDFKKRDQRLQKIGGSMLREYKKLLDERIPSSYMGTNDCSQEDSMEAKYGCPPLLRRSYITAINRKMRSKGLEQPYGCTFATCHETFGNKNDWARHEISRHFQVGTWRCDEVNSEGGACAQVFYGRLEFQDHLKQEHGVAPDAETTKDRLKSCRFSPNCSFLFWCGFCTKLIDLEKKGLEAWTERFDHIDDHFMGRQGFPKQSIQDWIPVDGEKGKGRSWVGTEEDGDMAYYTSASQSPTGPTGLIGFMHREPSPLRSERSPIQTFPPPEESLERPEKRPLDYDEAADSAKRLKTDGDHFASS